MYCPKCQDAMILTKATAFGEEYHYCRTCKKELKELQAPLGGVGGNGEILTSEYILDAINYVRGVMPPLQSPTPKAKRIGWALGNGVPCGYVPNGVDEVHNIPNAAIYCYCTCRSYYFDPSNCALAAVIIAQGQGIAVTSQGTLKAANTPTKLPVPSNAPLPIVNTIPSPPQPVIARSLLDELQKEIDYFKLSRGVDPATVEIAIDFWDRICDELEQRFGKSISVKPWPFFHWKSIMCQPGSWHAFSPTDWLTLT